MGEGIPIRLLHEASPHVVTVETKAGDTYRGTLFSPEDNMNVQLKKATRTRRDGQVSTLEHVFIRGSSVRFFILPDVLSNAPMFKRVQAMKEGRAEEARGLGRGRGYTGAMGRGALRPRAPSAGHTGGTGGAGSRPPPGRGPSRPPPM